MNINKIAVVRYTLVGMHSERCNVASIHRFEITRPEGREEMVRLTNELTDMDVTYSIEYKPF